jgi:hypothetical protein
MWSYTCVGSKIIFEMAEKIKKIEMAGKFLSRDEKASKKIVLNIKYLKFSKKY